MKKFLCTLLCLMLVFAMMPLATGVAFAAWEGEGVGLFGNPWKIGPQGKEASVTSWISGTDTLVISGTNAMQDFSNGNLPWETSKTNITKVIIEDGITKIGKNVFNGCSKLADITIPASVKKIDNGAFWDCTSLENITIPASVKEIGSGAFWNCSSLTDITIPAEVTSIGQQAFDGCASLATVTSLAITPPTLGDNVFRGCASPTIFVPSEAVASYTSVAGWTFYKIKSINWNLLAKAMAWTEPTAAATEYTVCDTEGKVLFTVSDTSDTNETRTIKLLADITAAAPADSALVVPDNKNIVLDLNDHVLNRGLIDAEGNVSTDTNGCVIDVEGELIVTDTNNNLPHQFNVSNGVWVFDEQNGTETATETVTGGIITGGTGKDSENCFYGGGIYVGVKGNLCILGGNIVGNYSEKGAGIYLTEDSIFVMTGGKIINNYSSGDGAVSKKKKECLVRGTLITMADGSKKPIEELSCGEIVRTFDHETGKISSAMVDVWKYPEKKSDILCLHFSDNIDVRVASGHCFFDKSANKYVAINTDNAYKYIGHSFYNADNNSWEELENITFEKEPDDAFIISTEHHLNCIANGMLSNEDGIYTVLANIFEFDDNLMIDKTKKENDISKWGLWDYSESRYIPIKTCEALNLKYISIALGKGMITKAQWEYVQRETANPYYEVAPFESTPLRSPLMLLQANDAELESGIYLGGTAEIRDNWLATVTNSGIERLTGISDKRNLYLNSDELIYLGNGQHGIATPTGGMCVGVTHSSATNTEIEPIQFTTGTNNDYSGYFFSDNEDYEVVFDKDHLELAIKKEEPISGGGGAYFNYDDYKAILEQAQKQQAELDAKKAEEEKLAKHEKLVEEAKVALADTKFKATSTKQTKLNGKKAIKLNWEVVGGTYSLSDFEGFDVFRSTKRYSGYGKTPFYTTTKWNYTNNKNLKEGKTYYYKVRAWKMVDGEKVYTGWSTKAWRTVK